MKLPGKSARTLRRDGQARSAPAWRRDHVTGPMPRIASSPACQRDRAGRQRLQRLPRAAPGGGGGTCHRRGRRPVSAPGAGEVHAGLMPWSRLGPGWPSASLVSCMHSRSCSCGLAGGAAACPRLVGEHSGAKAVAICVTPAMAGACAGQSRRVPSRVGSAGVILRGWELITRAGCHRRPGQREHCRSRSRLWARPARGSTIRTSATTGPIRLAAAIPS